MKKKFLNLMAAAFLLASLPFVGHAQNPKPFVIPEIKEWKGGEGTFSVASAKVVWNSPEARRVGVAFVNDLNVLCGIKLDSDVDKKGQTGNIILKIAAPKKDKKKKGKEDPRAELKKAEGYTITIGDNVEVCAATATGLYWGTRTLLQMLDGKEKAELPKGVITDSPDFATRGFMLDCARKFIPITYLRDLIKIMSYYKMNCLHIHLNDNGFHKHFENDWNRTYAAFRLECDTYPGLTARDGYYTKKEFRDLQKLGQEYGVEVLPEIDAPAHSLAFTHYDPSLGSERFGMDHLDITNPNSKKFLKNLWTEYLEGDDPVFIGPRVHIGTDEYSNSDKKVVELFRDLADDLIKHIECYGKQACMWGSLTHAKGETPVKAENVLMYMWYNGYADPDSMVNKLGYKALSIPDGLTYIVPHAGYYYDYLNCKHLYNNWTPNIIGNKTFDYDSKDIEGGMFAVWNDICGNGISVKDIHHRVFPAIQTLSAKFWTGKNVTLSYDEFNKKRLELHEAPGINELGRIGKLAANSKTIINHKASLTPNSKFAPGGNKEVGYNFSIEFDLDAVREAKGTVLFESPNATFYLADPITGRMGYERDGYLFSFDYAPYPGEKAKVCIEGDNKATYLYINGKLAEAKTGRTRWTDGKGKAMTIETLVFPLEKTGNFKSKISNVQIQNYFKYTK